MQSTQLYLDTARLGQMSNRAQRAHFDLARFASEEGASPHFERFLREGAGCWSASMRSRFPGLVEWDGISSLKEKLRILAGSKPELPVLVVNRSIQLMRFAARLLFQWCDNVLVTDLGWPPYREILEVEARRTGRLVTPLALREFISDGKTTEDDTVDLVRNLFQHTGCDGLFLTAVSHLGYRLPVERMVRALEAVRELRSVVVDGAQDFCHTSGDLNNEYCDLYLAGCHKWLQGFHPMGLGFYGRRRSRARIETLVNDLLSTGELDDPLLRFTTQIESSATDGETETVNLMPLFTCQGAAADALERRTAIPNSLHSRQRNLLEAASMAASCGWQPVLPAEPFRTGILLLQAERDATRRQSHQDLRVAFADEGVALTAYDGGFVRLSMPPVDWQPHDFEQLRQALQSVA